MHVLDINKRATNIQGLHITLQIASQPMTWKHQSINKQNYDHKEINKSKKYVPF